MSAARKVPRSRPAGSQLAPAVEPIRVGDAPRAADSQSPAVPESQTHGVPESRADRVTEPRNRPGRSEDTEAPLWRRLLRKEARLRYDQAAELTKLRHRVNRARRNRDEPLTDNTLLRVAVDLLFAHADELAGDTEDELRASVLPDSRTP